MVFSTTIQTTISPHDQSSVTERIYPSPEALNESIARAAVAQKAWAKVPLAERIAIGQKFIDEWPNTGGKQVPAQLTKEMGRPISQGAGEARGFLERAKYMLSIAESSLSDIALADTDKPGFKRFIRRIPLGVVLVIAPWNFPYLTSVNSVFPALIAGNAVLLKPSPQTPLSAEILADSLVHAGFPKDLIIPLHLTPELTTQAVQHPLVDFVSFTGSVAGGRAVEKAAVGAPGFKGVALELGGKDPAYIRADADLEYTVAEIVDGALFNSGQSCCAVERIYVHESVYDDFVARFVDIVKAYKLGDPASETTNLGPVVSVASADRIRKQVDDAIAAGAKALVSSQLFPIAQPGTAYVAPQVLVDVDHSMDVMKEETFGPVVGIQKVASDEEAVKLMNDSPYGLTASIWTNASAHPESEQAFLNIEDQLQCGTVYLNRCDYLDPALSWTGAKDSGRGISLSKFGYDQLTRAKSVHMKVKTS
ncbi:Succinate semialdehyde dehydrogenase [Mycena indigotica]|uniref:Succinate semialdehyde dehydrogenase n=1 Tax=Mycena indigotica TaxID=2126181 RepID=A0A8H6S0A2_9AGAR|nr:Succinate semialdehyde dehydrogenase [Mycena indigotica]KAF7289958.1 Succinate semialdehyde dehydrogenase [Mycena indigotica]